MLMQKRNSFTPWFDKDDTGEAAATEVKTEAAPKVEEKPVDTGENDAAVLDKALLQSTVRGLNEKIQKLEAQVANAKKADAPKTEVDEYEDDITALRREVGEALGVIKSEREARQKQQQEATLNQTASSVYASAKKHFDKQYENRKLFKEYPQLKEHIGNIVAGGFQQAVLGGKDASTMSTDDVNVFAIQEIQKFEKMLLSNPQKKVDESTKQAEVNAAIQEAGSGGTPSPTGAPKADLRTDPEGFWKEKRQAMKIKMAERNAASRD